MGRRALVTRSLASVVVVVLAVVVTVVTRTAMADTAVHRQQEAAITAVVQRAVILDQQLGGAVDGSVGTLRSPTDPSVVAAATSHPPAAASAAVVASRKTFWQAQIRAVFGETKADVQARETNRLNAVMADESGDRILGSGASSVDTQSVDIAGDDATVVAHATVWSASIGQQDQHGPWLAATPQNDMIVTAVVHRDADGTWALCDYHWDFAPGGGP